MYSHLFIFSQRFLAPFIYLFLLPLFTSKLTVDIDMQHEAVI